jgi:ABC-2 type transport system ATP-binding protein
VPDAILEAEGLGKSYANFELSGISFRLERGEVMGLIGPNGAGKTTTIRLLLGLARPGSGRAAIFGRDPARDKSVLGRVGFVFEECRLYGSATVRANAGFLSRVYPAWDEEAFRARLSEFGVDGRKKVDDLSKGQKTKLALAIALSHGAELLVLDEPTSGLDPASRSEILDLMYRFIGDGTRSALFSTHITADLEKIADRVTFLREGRLVFSEVTADALERHALVKGPSRALEAAKPYLVGARSSESGFEGLTDRASELAAAGDGASRDLALERASLDDIMVYSTREDYRARVGA